jgi:hypothetical protein
MEVSIDGGGDRDRGREVEVEMMEVAEDQGMNRELTVMEVLWNRR